MYLPLPFSESDAGFVKAVMREHSFATLVTVSAGNVLIDHLPTQLDESANPPSVLFHMALQNPHATALAQSIGTDTCAVFVGPHGYVSPSWYVSHPSVPTWNYVAIHVVGSVTTLTRAELEHLLGQMSVVHEGQVGGTWQFDDLPVEYRGELIDRIVGFRLTAVRVTAKTKLSQNRSVDDQRGVSERLLMSPDGQVVALGQLMKRRLDGP